MNRSDGLKASKNSGALPASNREIRVLVAEPDMQQAQRLVDFLSNSSIYVRFVRNGNELKSMLLSWRPDFILAEMMLPELNALELMAYLRAENLLGPDKIRVIVLSAHNDPANVRECQRLGAIDYLVEPYKYVDLLRRLILHAQAKREIAAVTSPSAPPTNGTAPATITRDEGKYFLHLAELVLREAAAVSDLGAQLLNLSKMAALPLGATRCSITECHFEERRGVVRASSDDASVCALPLDLAKYPEILYVLSVGKILALENLAADPTMQSIAEKHKSIAFNSMIVAPIFGPSGSGLGSGAPHQIWGVLHLRMPDSRKNLTDSEICFAQIVAHAAGSAISAQIRSLQQGRRLAQKDGPGRNKLPKSA